MSLIPLLLTAASAASLSYDDALAEVLQGNADVLGAEADRASAEGALLSSKGSWDPFLTGGPYRNQTTSSGISQELGIPYTFESTIYGWSAGLAETLPTGTSWSLNWTASNSLSVVETVIGGQTFIESDIGGYNSNLSLNLTQQLLEGWRMSYNMRSVYAAERSLASADVNLRSVRQEILVSAANAYWDLVLAQRSAEAALRAVEVAEEERRIVAAQVDVGNMAPIDLTRVDAALAQARSTELDLRVARDAAADNLAVILGRPPGQELLPSTDPGEVPMGLTLEVDASVEVAMSGSPALEVQRIVVELAEIDLANARHALLPSLAVTGSVGVNGFDEESYSNAFQQNIARELPTNFVGADLSMPLGNRASRGAHQSAAAALNGAKLDLDALERSVAQQVAVQVRAVQSARQKIELADLNLRLARETLAAEKARQEVGRSIQKDVLDAQNSLFNAEVDAARARVEFRQAMVQLKALQGGL